MSKKPRPKLNRNAPYVLIHHKPTRQTVVLNRTYDLVEVRNYLAGVPLGWKKVAEWDGWKPTMPSQLPEDLRDKPEADFFAFWVEEPKNKEDNVLPPVAGKSITVPHGPCLGEEDLKILRETFGEPDEPIKPDCSFCNRPHGTDNPHCPNRSWHNH